MERHFYYYNSTLLHFQNPKHPTPPLTRYETPVTHVQSSSQKTSLSLGTTAQVNPGFVTSKDNRIEILTHMRQSLGFIEGRKKWAQEKKKSAPKSIVQTPQRRAAVY